MSAARKLRWAIVATALLCGGCEVDVVGVCVDACGRVAVTYLVLLAVARLCARARVAPDGGAR